MAKFLQSKLGPFLLVLTIVGGLFSLVAWSFASPVGAGPDDDYHLASIWCGSGTDDSICIEGRNDSERFLPSAFSQSNCYALDSQKSAECLGLNFGFSSEEFGYTKRGNFSSDYPPVFYFVMSKLAGSNLELSVLMMRVFNALVFVTLSVCTFFVVKRNLRSPLLFGMALTFVPLGVFISTSINPSSWVLFSAALLWPVLVTYFSSGGTRKLFSIFISLALVIIATGSRADGGIFSVIACIVAMILTFENTKKWWKNTWLFGLIAVAFVLSFTISHQSNAGINGVAAGASDLSVPLLVVANLVQLPGLLAGVFGTWGLGWLDTEMPSSVWISTLIAFSSFVFIGISKLNKKKSLSLGILFAAVVMYPIALLVQSKSLVGANVQPRYVLPLIIMFAGVALFSPIGQKIIFTKLQMIIGGSLIWVAYVVALHTNIRRYVTGSEVLGVNLNISDEWWWSFGPSPMVIWAIGAVSFATLIAAITLAYIQGNSNNKESLVAVKAF